MNGLPYYKKYPRDFIEGTIGLPFEVKAAYALVLDLIYMQGGNLPDDARYIAGLLGVSVRKWNTLRQALVDAGKIEISGNFLTNYRAVIEVESAGKLSEKQRENRSNPNKNNNLQSPKQNHTDTDTDNIAKDSLVKQDDDAVADPVRVGKTVAEIMGKANDPRWLGNWALAQSWLAEGFDPEKDIFPVVTEICDRKRQAGQEVPYSLKYFTSAIRAHHQQRMDGTLPTRHDPKSLVVVQRGSPEFTAWIEHFKANGQRTGFREQQPSMTVPSKLPPSTKNEEAA